MKWLTLQKRILFSIVAVTLLAGGMCNGSGVVGTYSNANGMITLDLKSGGAASMTFMGESKNCTYKVEGKEVKLDCKEGEEMVFTVHEDGSMTGPGFVGRLTKSK